MSITGSSQLVARQKLTEYGGNLNEAVNSYFTEGDANTIIHETNVTDPQEDFMDIDETSEIATHRSPLLPARDTMNLFPTLGPDLNSSESHHPESGSRINDVTNTLPENVPEARDHFSIDYDEYFPPLESSHPEVLSEQNERVSGGIPSHDTCFTPSAPVISSLPDYGIEEEMIQAAIEASKREDEILQQNGAVPHQRRSQLEDPELDHVASLSVTSAEQEKFLCEQGHEAGAGPSEAQTSKVAEVDKVGTVASSSGRLGVRNSSVHDETQDADEQPLVRRRSRHVNLSSSLGSTQHQNVNNLADSEIDIPSDEWGGISSEEHDEALMLEAAMFGGVPEEAEYRVPYARRRYMRNGMGRIAGPGPYTRSTPRPPSPSLTAQRLIREQQDDEYLASLQADREKELLEQAAREAAMEEARRKEEDAQRKLEQEQEIERQLAAKEASLPQEPSSDDENAVTLLVRMPDGGRRGRRFLRTDKLQYLFDFIDVGRVIKPSTYRLVRPYPRRAFSNEESELTLNELGLSSKQEALFLELI